MDGERLPSARDLLDMNFQSLAMKHMDLKQMELDTAAAKVDELTKQLESLWSDNPTPPPPSQAGVAPRLSRSSPGPGPDHGSRPPPPRSRPPDGSDPTPALAPYSPLSPKGRPASPRPSIFLQPETFPTLGRAPSPRPGAVALRSAGPLDHPGAAAFRPIPSPQYLSSRAASPRLGPSHADGPGPQIFFPDRVPSPRPTPSSPFDGSPPAGAASAFAPLRAQDDLTLRRRPPKTWNESDLDLVYEKKPSHSSSYERLDVFGGLRQVPPGLQLSPWRESSLDGAGGPGKDGLTSSTLPRNYKVSPLASDRRPEPGSYRRSLPPGPPGTLPRSWQPASRIPMPPASAPGRAPRQRPIPLSMIFKLQNAFWQYGAATAGPPGSPILSRVLSQSQPVSQPQLPAQPQAQPQLPPQPQPPPQPQQPQPPPQPQQPQPPPQPQQPQPQAPAPQVLPPGRAVGVEEAAKAAEPLADAEAELEGLLLLPVSEGPEAEEVPRPLSPTRLQPALPPEAQTLPELEEVVRVLADIPRPLKRRGSMEQSPAPALPPTHKKQYQQLISRLFHRQSHRQDPGGAAAATGPDPDLGPINEGAEAKAPTPAPPAPTPPPTPPQLLLPEPAAPQSPVRVCQHPAPVPPSLPPSPSVSRPSPGPAGGKKAGARRRAAGPPADPAPLPQETRSVLRKAGSPRKSRRARLNPLVRLLDAALTGELDVVQQAVKEMNDPSQPNDEGITALHNAICGANYSIVDFLIGAGANVNSPDSHGWTPLHCAASCNDTAICTALVKHGASVFATTFSDGAMAIEKCDPYRDGYADCVTYLADAEQSLGLMNNGAVYALWDYSAEFGDELSFREGEPVTVLRRDGPEETDWWWASLYGHEGYVPRNYFGLFPRVRLQRHKV
ncbi:relA-associated inhibitor isoform X1 [Tachyglossus aculeatus]|uniref:relA-associated inhibitor isoform X1 n=1 Tax=Tachyglossus aculeatus TaxID=9261 RepID=UPI0018F78A39|nr:relA-associated inhibitor isoform X1 [Tachyglossus aculeatus]